jgi:flagellar biosynthesis protein FlhF
MRIKKFIVSNMQEGHEMIERELGKEAIILSSRNTKLQNGTSAVEIVAALDEKNLLENKIKSNTFNNSSLLKPKQNEGLTNEINTKLISEIASLKDVINEMSENIKYKYTGTMSPNLAKIFKILRNSDISEDFALEIIGRITIKGYANEFKQAIDEARRVILNRLKFANPIAKMKSKQIVTFLGATGSGKTTSLIKLAIISKLLNKSNVLIISTDTYKVGGFEQLQTLASISGIAFATAYSPEELKNIIREESKFDLIMIDTVGRNPNNYEDMKNIMEFQKAVSPDLTYLVISATTSESALENTISKFERFLIDKSEINEKNDEKAANNINNKKTELATIITKVDESSGLGNIVSALHKRDLPLAYFTTGQLIPDDIEPADSEKLNEYLFIV